MAFVRLVRADHDRPTWFDVSAAYDAGIKHAIEARESAKQQIALRDERGTQPQGVKHE